MKKLKNRYFVSYYFTDDNSGGFGNININSLKPLRSTEDIKIVSDYIRDNHIPGVNKSVIILNWRRYDK